VNNTLAVCVVHDTVACDTIHASLYIHTNTGNSQRVCERTDRLQVLFLKYSH